jgi:hypothetical protein
VYVGLSTGDVIVYSLAAFSTAAPPLVALPALHPGRACHSILVLPDTPSVGGHLLTASDAGPACYLVGRPPGRPPAPFAVGAQGGGACVGLTWDAGARAAVATMADGEAGAGAGARRHVCLHPSVTRHPRSGMAVGRAWRRGATLTANAAAAAAAAGDSVLLRCRGAAVPSRGGDAAAAEFGAGGHSLFASGDEARRCVALWDVSSGGAPPKQLLSAHADGPVLDVRVDAHAAARRDGAGRLLLTLSAGELRVHARDALL